mmetsp:Transcript_21392/g.46450  ORF Transcript_21392/g.46450 Transcript_21392/m.46450 type:complete len:203 (-) Transcript_21392:182-790(-)
MMMASWLRSALMLTVLICTLTTSSSAEVGENERTRFIMGRKIEVISGNENTDRVGDVVAIMSEMSPNVISPNNMPKMEVESSIPTEASNLPKTTIRSNPYQGTRGGSASVHRKTQDVDEILNDMATRDPSEWSAVEWLIMIGFLSFFGWLGCCLCTLCCCGGGRGRGGGGSNILGWLCCWEIFCRGGSDIDACCDYGLAGGL